MDAWSRAVRQRDTEMFASCYWGNARQLIVTADGSRSTVTGVNAITESFRQLLTVYDADATRLWLPVPLRYRNPEDGALQFIYRDRSYPAINMVQFEERDGRWALAEQHIYWRNLSSLSPGPIQRPYDSNNDGTLDPAEQSAMVEAYWLVTTGRHGVITSLDELFDFDGNGYISVTESRRARSVLLRDRLRDLPAIYPEFADLYLPVASGGEVAIHAANASLRDFIDSETAIRPQRVTDADPQYAVADFDEDGWIGPGEIYAYAEMIVRVLAAIPEPLAFSKETDGSTEEIVRWTDGNSDGVVSDTELNDLGYLVFAALSGDPIIASAPLCRFDQNRDFLLSVPEQEALRAYFAIELLPQTVARFSDTYPAVSLLDTDGSGELSRIEITSAMELISSPDDSVGTRANSPLDSLMDRKPRDGRLSEWEIWSVVGSVLAASSRQWIESRLGDSTIVRFERKTGISLTEPAELALRSSTAPTVSNDVSSLLRAARSASSNRVPRAGADGVGAETVQLTMPAGSVADATVRLAARLDPVFPVMYKWYADSHIGYAYVENTSNEPITDVIARVHIPRLADSAIDSSAVLSIDSKEVLRIAVPALLNETAVLAITEGRTAAATVEVEYTAGADRQTISQTVQLEFYDRNAITWDDDRKASAFVTARDDQVMLFSGNLHASMYREFRIGLSRELQLAMLMFSGLAEHGMVYRTDPSSPYADYSQDQLAVDYLQFPRQTLAFRNGDCDDLSVAYAALLEAVGVAAAFITTPGHIFVGVQLNTTEDEARRTYLFPDDLIYTEGGEVWLPVEVTALRGTFLEAWSIAAREWRDASRNDGSRGDDDRLIPVRAAWQVYAPVGLSGFTFPLSAPDSPRVVQRCLTELTQFVAREIADREATLVGRLEADPSDHELRNRLGTLYARYGLMEKATVEFERIAA